jgi:hypothetical protein
MKTLTLTALTALILLAFVTASSRADTYQMRKVVICDARDEVFGKLANDFHEQPVWTGASGVQETRLVLTVNESTGEWTMVEFTDSWACVLAVGNDSRQNDSRVEYNRVAVRPSI